MSQADIEIFRAYHEEIIRANKEDVDTEATTARMAQFWDPEVEYDMSKSPWLDLGGVYRGMESVQQLWREWLTAWDTFHFKYELVDAGSDRVVVLLDTRMRGRSTGIEVAAGETAFVTIFRDGRIFRNKLYPSHSEALEDAGLTKQDAHADS